MLKRCGGAPIETKPPITSVMESMGDSTLPDFQPHGQSCFLVRGRSRGHFRHSHRAAGPRTHHCDGDHTPNNRAMGRVTAKKIDLLEISANMVHCYRDEIHGCVE